MLLLLRRSMWTVFVCLSATSLVVAQAPQAANAPLLAEGVPTVKSWVVPVYPEELKATKVQGSVVVQYIVDAQGGFSGVRVIKSTDARFEAPAIAAISKWTFEPGVEASKAVKMCVRSKISFHWPEPKPGLLPPQPSWPVEVEKIPAVAESTPDPIYPDALVPRQLNGDVQMAFSIGEDGTVSELKVLNATRPDFVQPMVAAVRGWKYKPAKRGDLAVADVKVSDYSFFVYVAKFEEGVPTQLQASGLTLRVKEGQAVQDLCTAPPEIWQLPDPVYPYALAVAGQAGAVTAEFDLSAQGSVENAKIVSSDHEELGQAVLASLAVAKFKPAMKDGHTASVPMSWKYVFVQPEEKVPESGESSELRLLRALKAGEAVASPKGLDGKLNPLWRVPPAYPETLRPEGTKGSADVEFIIDREGRIRWPRVVKATHPDFGQAALVAINQWAFDRPTRGGQPADVRVRVPIQFAP